MRLLLLLALSTVCLAADVTGKWTGTLTPTGENAESALVILKQDGEKVTGTAGGNAEDQREIQNGKAVNGTITFEIALGKGMLKASLKQDGDALSGDVSAEMGDRKMTAKLDLKREK